MIELIFELANEVILVVINGKDVQFGNTTYGAQLADISGMKLDYHGVCHEFPDLELRDDWREEACERFKDKIRNMESEDKISDYIIIELEKHGYTATQKRRNGFRPVSLR